uniref:Uncharacterized protein n=1 Tax=Setaria viridis TaxID=4556 RepID=A0A4U6TJN4_SETVI|nr:hypothetical protein SEVIR_8G159500v2 [Setaria viridis]
MATEDDDRRPSPTHTTNDQQMVTGFDGRRPTPPHTAGDHEMATEDDGPDEFLFEPPRTRANITFFNLVCLKSKLGYCGRAFLYYKERCGRNTAVLVPLDYDHQIPAMLQSNSKDRKIRILLIRDQQTNLQDEQDTGRDETIETYTEWLRRKEYLQDIISYLDQDDNDEIENLPNDEGLAAMQSPPSDRLPHARRDKKAIKGGRGALKCLSAAIKRIRSGSQKLKIEFSTKLGGPVGPNARSFVDEIVMFTRKMAPLIGVNKWKDVNENVKNSIASDMLVCTFGFKPNCS